MAFNVEDIIAVYGVAAVFLGTAIEGETVAIAGGLLAHHGLLPYWQVAVAAAGGAYLTDNLLFVAGRRFQNHRWVRALGKQRAVERAIAALERRPTAFLLGFRFVPGFRTVGPLSIAASNVSAVRYMAVTAIASVVWGLVATGLGFVFGRGIEAVLGELRRIEHQLILPTLLILVPLILVIVRRRRQRATKPTDQENS